MKVSMAILALAASAYAVPQAVTEKIKPEGKPPKGCTPSFDSKFEVSIFRVGGNEKRAVSEDRKCGEEGVLVLELNKGILKDGQGRTGYISESFQFQFDDPPQSGSLFTAGFSACSNHSLALGSTTVFWQCLSGDFYNLYDRNWAEQCEPVEFVMMPCGKGSGQSAANAKRKVVGSSVVATTVVTVVSDGKQLVLPTTIAVPMCQIGDGQVQVRTTPCDNMEIPIVTAPPVSQASNGRLQVPSTVPPAPPAPPVAPADVPVTPQGGSGSEPTAPAQPSSNRGQPAGTPNPAGDINPAGSPNPAGDINPAGTPEVTGAPNPTDAAANPTGAAANPTGGVNPADISPIDAASDAANATGEQAPAGVTGGPCDGPNSTAAECIGVAQATGPCEGPNATAEECIGVAQATGVCDGPNSTAAECIAQASGNAAAGRTTVVRQTSRVSKTVMRFDTGTPTATGSGSDAQDSDSDSDVAPASPPPTSNSNTFTPSAFAPILVAIVASMTGAFLIL